MRSLAVLCLVVGIAVVALLGGCGGGGNEVVVVPEALVGLWGAVGFDNGNPGGGLFFEVQDDGDIVARDLEARAAGLMSTAQVDGAVIGRITNSNGSFRVQFVSEDSTTVTATGTLGLDDTGQGTWRQGGDEGTMELWRANWTQARTLAVNILGGPQPGTATVAVGADGIVSGTVTAMGTTTNAHGVVTGAGHVAAGTEMGDNFILIEGDLTATGAAGTWTMSDGTTGTWTAVFT
jgi:hypothetical protein